MKVTEYLRRFEAGARPDELLTYLVMEANAELRLCRSTKDGLNVWHKYSKKGKLIAQRLNEMYGKQVVSESWFDDFTVKRTRFYSDGALTKEVEGWD